jgi:methionine synthase II (cobalamin-independent)
MPTDNMKQRISSLEKRIAKLEKAAVRFEEHRQAWINLNKGLKKLDQEIARDKRKQLEREKSIKELGSAAGSSPITRTRTGARAG